MLLRELKTTNQYLIYIIKTFKAPVLFINRANELLKGGSKSQLKKNEKK